MSRGFTAAKSTSRFSASNSDANVLGRSVRVRGRLSGDGDLRIEGDVEGDVRVSGALELADGGSVNGDVSARSVTIEGALTGQVQAEGPVLIRASARVTGNMNGSEVALEEGAAFSGRIEAEFDLPDDLSSGGAAPTRGRRGR